MAETPGTEKVSSGPSESSASEPPSSGSVDCVCEVQAIHDVTVPGEGGAYFTTLQVAAAGTCDVTITSLTTSYSGSYTFTPPALFMPSGTESPFYFDTDGDPSGAEVFIHFTCQNGHEDVVGFTIP